MTTDMKPGLTLQDALGKDSEIIAGANSRLAQNLRNTLFRGVPGCPQPADDGLAIGTPVLDAVGLRYDIVARGVTPLARAATDQILAGAVVTSFTDTSPKPGDRPLPGPGFRK